MPPARRPWTTYGLLLAILLALLVEVLVVLRGMDLAGFVSSYGLVSANFSWTDPSTYLPLITFNFLHSGARHFTGNAVMLLLAGAAVEKHAGWRATLFIWMAGGVIGGITHLFIFPDIDKTLIGSSGATSALIGAALIIGWRWALPVRLRRGRRPLFSIPLPAVTAIWLAHQLIGFSRAVQGSGENVSVATWAHLAGFSAGALCACALVIHQRKQARQHILSPASAATD